MVSIIKKMNVVCLVVVILLIFGYNTSGTSGTLNPLCSLKPLVTTNISVTVNLSASLNIPTVCGFLGSLGTLSNSRTIGTESTTETTVATGETETTGTAGKSSKVVILDKNTRTHLQAELTMADYTAFAETVTDKMLSSRVVKGWGEKRPKLIVAALRNNTDNENIRMQDVHDRITETILESGVARLMDISSTDFDYVVRTELSSTRQLGAGKQELAFFKLEFKLFTQDGEMIGQWSDVLPLGKVK